MEGNKIMQAMSTGKWLEKKKSRIRHAKIPLPLSRMNEIPIVSPDKIKALLKSIYTPYASHLWSVDPYEYHIVVLTNQNQLM